MPKNRRTRRNKPAANTNANMNKRIPLNLLGPTQELSRLRHELNAENMTNYERKRKELRVKVLERQLTIPGLNGGRRRTRRS